MPTSDAQAVAATNEAAPGCPYFTPLQQPPAGTALVPQKDGKAIPTLFQPITIRGLTFRNRIFLSSLCQFSSEDGFTSPWHMAHLGGIITRGPGLSMVEASAIQSQGRISPWDLGIWSDDHITGLAEITQFAHSQGQRVGMQLAHAGRKASVHPPWVPAILVEKEVGGWPDDVWGPSAVSYQSSDHAHPKELTVEGIQQVVKDYASAAKRAVAAGFDVIEIHNGHGFLLHQFVSPVSNKRTDEYGGSFENRIRLTLEVVDAVRAVIPETMPLFLRISATDWLEVAAPDEPSWRSEDTVRLAHHLAEHGVDLIDITSGSNDPRQKIISGPGYQVPFAAAVKKSVGSKLLVGAVGGLGDGKLAQKVLDDGSADIIFVGRMFQKNPGMVWAMADDLGVDISLPKQMEWAFKGRATKIPKTN